MKTILLIEDEPTMQTALRAILGRAGYKVLGTSSIAEATRVWAEARDAIDLIISDNSLPDGSGIEAVRRFESDKPAIPIIIASGLPHGDLPPHYFQLMKPFKAEFLLAFVRGGLNRRFPETPTGFDPPSGNIPKTSD